MLDGVEDCLSSIVALLKPEMTISKVVEAGGQWQVERHDLASPFYCAIAEGVCRIEVTGRPPLTLVAGDFILIPDPQGFRLTSSMPPKPEAQVRPLEIEPGRVRLGPADAPVEMRALVGHCRFEATGRDLLVSLLPEMIHVSGHDRLMALVPVIHAETRADRPGRGLVLERLLEVLLIEALRSGPVVDMPPGLLRGLSNPRLAAALRRIHLHSGGEISVTALAKDAGMSRSGFFELFRREIGRAPMEYVTEWRMAIAKALLRQGELTNAQISSRVGYGSASAFGMAFVRHEGFSPRAFAGKQDR
ncbi:AraC family transcriptional regulator [Paracoccus liaowanqingii]|uniref:AraC family transcriptional regulator n=1 Tax=Paracoccus liaowanqingii TaxID=2560053 RepID=A0A4Z1C427_9RHOB|nr:AraC family transcriptional regulator [Paracoccus liaowanqingii]TGN37545.1 AraC family transcriptional regulator [Paracoccus liaowanqingii]